MATTSRTMQKILLGVCLSALLLCSIQYASADDGAKTAAYQPAWESLDSHPAPEWFEDAKLGMFVDWGLYSLGGWAPRKDKGAIYPDWYLLRMYEQPETREFHKKTFGETFQRDDFIPQFTAAEYDPEGLASLAAEAGMKYIVPFCKHHDGFCLWDSSYTDRTAAKMGPKRDLVRPLVDACVKHGLKFGFYFSLDEWEYPVLGSNGERLTRFWSQGPIRTVPFDENEMKGKIGGKKPVRDFVGEYIVPQAEEFITKYDPDILWFDGEWDMPAEERRTLDITAFFYNHAEGRKQVAVNDRLGAGTRAKHGDFFTSEYHDGNASLVHKWEENRSIGQSYGYNRDDTDADVLSPTDLVHMFVDIVSQGGNLLLMVNPNGPGAMPEMQVKRLKALGEWLRVNGEGIYATRQNAVIQEGTVRFTRSKDGKYVYAICLEWPEKELALKSVRPVPGSSVMLLGRSEPLQWRQDQDAVAVSFPAEKPCDAAWVLRFEVK